MEQKAEDGNKRERKGDRQTKRERERERERESLGDKQTSRNINFAKVSSEINVRMKFSKSYQATAKKKRPKWKSVAERVKHNISTLL